MIEVKEVKTKRDMKRFATYPTKLYKDCEYYVPSLLSDELNIEDNLAEHQESTMRLQLLAQAMGKLNDRERAIIQARRLSESPDTLDSLGERLGISRERVRQIENRAVEKMTQFIQARAGALA